LLRRTAATCRCKPVYCVYISHRSCMLLSVSAALPFRVRSLCGRGEHVGEGNHHAIFHPVNASHTSQYVSAFPSLLIFFMFVCAHRTHLPLRPCLGVSAAWSPG
jgi:hypothetical protein